MTGLVLPLAEELSERSVQPSERRGRSLHDAGLDAMQLACAERRGMGKLLSGHAEAYRQT